MDHTRRDATRSSWAAFQGSDVLVVDDTPDVQRLLERWLEHRQSSVRLAGSVAEAIACIDTAPPDLVVLDYLLPDGDGMAVCRHLRGSSTGRQIPVLMMTAHGDNGLHVAALEAGIDDFIAKPLTRQVVMARLRSLIQRSRAQAETRRLNAVLSRYVSTAARHQAVEQRRPEHVEGAVLFSDLRGFTSTSFQHSHTAIFEAINDVLGNQARLVRAGGGYVDKFSGDGMLAVFDNPGGAERAVATAREIVRWAHEANDRHAFWNPLPIGLGIHEGPFARGDIGDDVRREFTVIGHTVNLAARLCGSAQALEVLVTDTVLQGVSDRSAVWRSTPLQIRGLPDPVLVHGLRWDEQP